MLSEVENGIPDELSRSVESDVASALDLVDPDPAALQILCRERHALRPGTTPQGDHGLVFHQEEDILAASALHSALAEASLQLEHLGIRRPAEVTNEERPAHAPALAPSA